MQSPIRRTNMMARVGAIRQARDATPSPASGWRCPTRDFTHRPAGRAPEGPIHRPYSSIGTRCMHRPCAERGTKTIRSFVRDGARSTGLTPCATFVPSVGRGRGAVAFAAPRAPVGSVCLLRIRSTLFPCVLFWIGTRTTLPGAGATGGTPLLVLRITFSFRGCALRTFLIWGFLHTPP
jgi:hypothetical protein